jgi:hypothetical protein
LTRFLTRCSTGFLTRSERYVEGVLQAWSEDFRGGGQLAATSSRGWCVQEDVTVSAEDELANPKVLRTWMCVTYFPLLPVTMLRRGRVLFSFPARPVVAGAVLGVNEVKLVEGVPRVVASSEV